MRIRVLGLIVAVLASCATPAAGAIRISDDRGGQIGHYLEALTEMRSSGQRVIIDGDCLSACTLVLSIIPRSRLCATGHARFGFHAAWLSDSDGHRVTSVPGTRALWRLYPSRVRRWIARHGGLSRHMIYLNGRALTRIVPSCSRIARRAHSRLRRRYARPSRYQRANAANDRR